MARLREYGVPATITPLVLLGLLRGAYVWDPILILKSIMTGLLLGLLNSIIAREVSARVLEIVGEAARTLRSSSEAFWRTSAPPSTAWMGVRASMVIEVEASKLSKLAHAWPLHVGLLGTPYLAILLKAYAVTYTALFSLRRVMGAHTDNKRLPEPELAGLIMILTAGFASIVVARWLDEALWRVLCYVSASTESKPSIDHALE